MKREDISTGMVVYAANDITTGHGDFVRHISQGSEGTVQRLDQSSDDLPIVRFKEGDVYCMPQELSDTPVKKVKAKKKRL